MEEPTIEVRIRRVLGELLGAEVMSVGKKDSFRDFVGERFDSLMAVEVITAIENSFSIEVDYLTDDVRYWFETLEKIEKFVIQKLEDQRTLREEE